MILFNHANHTYTVTITGDYSEYLQVLKAIIQLVGMQTAENFNADATCYVLSLLEDMLLSEEQFRQIAV